MNFKINSRPLFTIIFKLKNDNFKTRDYSPLIERVLAGVWWIVKIRSNTLEQLKYIEKELYSFDASICSKLHRGKSIDLLIPINPGSM